jgi:hypothetical protein
VIAALFLKEGGHKMRKRKLHLLVALTLCTLPAKAIGADIKSIKISEDQVAILILGDIQNGDGAKFRSEAGKFSDALVLLESDGGKTAEAIEIGQAIRLKGFGTAVVNGSSCNSACGLIWLAGAPRTLSKSGRVGFHATYTDDHGRTTESGVGNAIVGRYLTLLNLPERAVIFATSASPSELNWLTSENYRFTGIDVQIIDDIKWDPPSNAPATSKETTIWKETSGWLVAIDNTLQQGCFLLSAFNNETIFRIGIDGTGLGRYYLALANPHWKSLKVGDIHKLVLNFDSQTPWDVPMKVVKLGETPMLLATFSDKKFWTEFIAAQSMHVKRGSTPVTSISMSGTSAGFDEMVRCQKGQLSRRRPDRDPFAK